MVEAVGIEPDEGSEQFPNTNNADSAQVIAKSDTYGGSSDASGDRSTTVTVQDTGTSERSDYAVFRTEFDLDTEDLITAVTETICPSVPRGPLLLVCVPHRPSLRQEENEISKTFDNKVSARRKRPCAAGRSGLMTTHAINVGHVDNSNSRPSD